MKHSNKKYLLLAVLPIIGILFFVYTLQGMQSAERALITLYTEHTTLVEELVANPENKANLTAQFAEKIKLSTAEERKLKQSATLQKTLDKITFNTPHCINAPRSNDCRVYNDELIIAAKNRYGKLLILGSKEPQQESILSGKVYSTKDYARTAFILVLEGLALTSILLWVWSKKK